MYPGRVEAKYTVPASTTLSVSSGALASAVSVTWTAASYFHTAAGGVLSGLSVLQNQINFAVGGHPDNASSLTACLGYGTATGGWLMQEASGDLTPTIGAVALTDSGTPVYQNAGPGQGTNHAISFDTATEYFDGGANFDVGANDLMVAAVIKFSALTGGTIVSKAAFALGSGWVVYFDGANILISVVDGGGTKTAFVTPTALVNEWCAMIACVDRSTGKLRIGLKGLTTGTTLTATEVAVSGNITTAANFRIGADAWLGGGSTAIQYASLYVGTGSGVATGLSANMSTALTGLANATNSGFTVSMSTTTGLITLSNSFWPCSIDFTSTDARDLLGFAYEFNYPATAAQMAAALGYGTWTSGAGYLCNESSGNLASAFGSPATLTASSLTYSHQGARGGNDKAISFDAGTDYADGGDNFDVTASGDLIVAWVGKFSANVLAQTSLVSKYGTPGWLMSARTTGQIRLSLNDGGLSFDIDSTSSGSLPGEFHVGVAVIDRSTNTARVGTIGLRSGTTTTGTATSIAGLGSLDYAGSFRVGQDAVATFSASSFFQISALYVVTGSGVATGLSANLSTALSNFATYMKSQTSTQQARGLWFPDCTQDLEGDAKRAPIVTDARQSMTAIGEVLTLIGSHFKRHRNIVYSHVPLARTWEAEATYAHASWEWFYKETQLGGIGLGGLGSSWFPVGSALQLYDHAGVRMGQDDATLAGWKITGLRSIEPRKAEDADGWTGFWRIEIPRLIAIGA